MNKCVLLLITQKPVWKRLIVSNLNYFRLIKEFNSCSVVTKDIPIKLFFVFHFMENGNSRQKCTTNVIARVLIYLVSCWSAIPSVPLFLIDSLNSLGPKYKDGCSSSQAKCVRIRNSNGIKIKHKEKWRKFHPAHDMMYDSKFL